jgi:hypothetical protein
MLHTSDLVNMRHCPRYAWTRNHNRERMPSFYHPQGSYTDLWSRWLRIEDSPAGKTGDDNETSMAMLANNVCVRHIRLEYRGLRVHLPLMERLEQGWRLVYAPKTSLPRFTEALGMKIDVEVCKRLGIDIQEVQVIYMNRAYVRQESLDLDELFVRSSFLYNRNGQANRTIQEWMELESLDLDKEIDEANVLLAGEKPEARYCSACGHGRACLYFDDCWKPKDRAGDDILFLKGLPDKLSRMEGGLKSMTELEPQGKGCLYAQLAAAHGTGRHLNREALQSWLDKLEWPLSFLDFEWDTYAVPPYAGMKPFEVLCFQYSLHVMEKDGELKHYSYFGSQDCRKAFLESLQGVLPDTGSIVVYNMEGAEKLRLMQLAQQYEDFRPWIEAACARMVDLSKPFERGLFYDVRMKGKFSLKNVLEIFSEETYKTLSIQNGMEAVHAYRAHGWADETKKREIEEKITAYCSMDTYAEILVLQGLWQLMEE